MNVLNVEDDELANAMYLWLVKGPRGSPPIVAGRPWRATRQVTQEHFALRFPRCMDRGKKGGK